MSDEAYTLAELAKRHDQLLQVQRAADPKSVNPYKSAHRGAAVAEGWTVEEETSGELIKLTDDEYLYAIANIEPEAAKRSPLYKEEE